METRERIIQAYQHYLREKGRQPATVFKFCQSLEIGEKDFFANFSSFDSVESAFWEELAGKTADAVTQGPDWAGFGARQRLLSYLFAFLEESLHYRSLLLVRVAPLKLKDNPAYLRGLRRRFVEFAEAEIVGPGIESGEIADRGRINELYAKSFYLILRGVMNYHLHDESTGFERTDAAAEKSVTFAFDLMRRQALDAAFDLAKFLKSDRQTCCCS
ncbi:MAG: TetR family transcriptional regulator C-terminal domain-containing protein [Verrucomicrobiota bacterium]